MNKLITVQAYTPYTTNVIIAEELKTGVRSTDKDIHRDINRVIEKLLSKDARFVDQTVNQLIGGVSKKPNGMRLTEGKAYRLLSNDRGEEYRLIAYRGKNNKLALTWSMNARGYLRFIMRLSGYRNADKIQSKVIDSFMLMRDVIKNQPHPLEEGLYSEPHRETES